MANPTNRPKSGLFREEPKSGPAAEEIHAFAEMLRQQSSSNIDEGISVRHNLYDLLGNTLLQGVSDGELDTEKIKKAANKLHLQDVFLRLGLDLGKDYGAHIGYGDY